MTTTMYNNNLATLEAHTGLVNSNIELFNRYIMDNRVALKNRGHDIDEDDMLELILNAYLLAQDNQFHQDITQIKTGINDGSVQHIAEQLMNMAFYKARKDKGTWVQQSPEHQQIIALMAKLKKLEGGLKLSDQLQSKLKAVVEQKKARLVHAKMPGTRSINKKSEKSTSNSSMPA